MTPSEMAEEVARRIKADGVATVKVADGRMLYLSVAVLRRMLESATSDTEVVALLIRDPLSVS